MTKFIHVVGLSNTGKTTAICDVALDLQARPMAKLLSKRPHQYVETTKVIEISSGGQTYLVGLASAGDNDLQLQKNFDFLRDYEQQSKRRLDFIVCASHTSRSSTYQFVLAQMAPNDTRVEIPTIKVAAPNGPTPQVLAQIAAQQMQMNQAILNELP